MKTNLVLFGALALLSTGCFTYPIGAVYDSTTVPHPMNRIEAAGTAKTGAKAGEACATGILGLFAFGDASLDAAKKAGGITDVHSTEFKNFQVLGIYQQACTQVHGN